MNLKLIIFDFDCTLTTRHFYNWINHLERKQIRERLEKGQSTQEDKHFYIETFFGGMERLRALARTLQEVNALKIICSKGLRPQIEQLCLLVFGHKLFHTLFYLVYARITEDQFPNDLQKDIFIKNLIRLNEIQSVIYFDDDPNDHKRLVQHLPVTPILMYNLCFEHTLINRCEYFFHNNNSHGIDFCNYGFKLVEILNDPMETIV
jgi:hypothetical protein